MKHWLYQEPSLLRVALTVLTALAINFSYLKFLVSIVPYFSDSKLTMKIIGVQAVSAGRMILTLIFAFIEEVVFRLPLVIAISAERSPYSVLIFALMLSVIFGVMHGSIWNILSQGVRGGVYCLVFLVCGGMSRHIGIALATTTTLHFLYNVVLDMLVCETKEAVA